MATCPAGLSAQITQLTALSRLLMRVTHTKKSLGTLSTEHEDKIRFSSSAFIPEPSSNYGLAPSSRWL